MSDFKPVTPGLPEDDDPNEKFPFLHTITVVDRVVSVDKPELVQNNIRTESVTLNLDSEWEGLSCLINIGNDDSPVSLIWSGQPVVIPAELMTDTGTLNVSVVGYGDDGAVRAVTKKADAMFTVVASGYVEGDEPVPDPTTILGQLTEAADKANQAADRFNQASEDIGDISDAVTEVKGYVDGFGLTVGTTTTGEPGSDAAVEIQKNGTKYTVNFTIPRGNKGEQGEAPSLSRTMADPESQWWNAIDFNDFTENGVYTFNGGPTNSPRGDSQWISGTLIVAHSEQSIMQLCAFSPTNDRSTGFAFRNGDYSNPSAIIWDAWRHVAFLDDLPNASALANEMGDIASLSTRVQALEARVKSLETN